MSRLRTLDEPTPDTAGCAEALHVFDMDGTLLLNTTASLEIARHLECLSDLTRLEARFASGELDTRGFAREVCRMWEALTPALVEEVFHGSPWIGGLREVTADIRRRGERSVVITMSPDFYAEHLTMFGVDEVVSSRFPPMPFHTDPDPDGILTPADKVTVTERILHREGLDRSRCVAYGDSGSDLLLFAALRCTVAVNASEQLRAMASLCYDGDDLREVYHLARQVFLDGIPGRGLSVS